jgi:cytochrome c oxidase subunit I
MNSTADSRAHALASPATSGLRGWLTTTDHKRIGLLYIATSLLFFAVAIGFAMVMRTQLATPRAGLVSPETYNQVFTMHGTTMVFLFGMPILAGFGNYMLPLLIGARDMAFPRMNALSYWAYLFGGLLLYSSFAFGGAIDTGWFSYTPLSNRSFSGHDGVDFWVLFIILTGISSLLGAVNFVVTTVKMRAPGMRLQDIPVFAFATFVNSFLILFAIPSLTVGVVMLYLDRNYGTAFFDVPRGGDPLLWQHLFWFFGHPEVYILVLPAFGMLSEVVPVFSRKPLFGRGAMLIAIGLIGFYGFLVWAHHMFAVGLPFWFNVFMAGASFLIAVPTGIKLFNWLATMWGGALRFNTSLKFAAGMIGVFTVGGLTGVSLAVVPFNWQVTDTYYVVAHFHNTLIGGTVFGVMAALYYWFPKATGRLLGERLGLAHFLLYLFGFLLTFMPLHVVGLLGMPRRVYTWQEGMGWEPYNLVSTMGGYMLALGTLVLLWNIGRSLISGKVAGDDPWDAWTLEWATTSPPPHYNFATLPLVRGPRPLWDLKKPDRADWRRGHGHAEEPAAQRVRAASVGKTAADLAGPSGMVALPPPHEHPYQSAAPITLAVGLLAIAAGFLSSLIVVALAAVFVLGALIAWLWEPAPEEPEPFPPARYARRRVGKIGQAITYRTESAPLATLLFIGSEAVFFAALIYSYFHLRYMAMEWPPAGMPDLPVGIPAFNTFILVTSGVLAHWGMAAFRRGDTGRFRWGVGLAVVLGSLFLAGQIYEYGHVGFGLSDGLLGSTFFTLTGFHGAHVAAGLIAFIFLLLRSFSRDWGPRWIGAAEATTYYWHFVDVVWLILFTAVYLI